MHLFVCYLNKHAVTSHKLDIFFLIISTWHVTSTRLVHYMVNCHINLFHVVDSNFLIAALFVAFLRILQKPAQNQDVDDNSKRFHIYCTLKNTGRSHWTVLSH